MPQDDKLADSLRDLSEIAQTLGRMEAIERQFNMQVKSLEDRLTTLENNVEKFSKQLDRTGTQLQGIKEVQDKEAALSEDVKKLTDSIKEIGTQNFLKAIDECTIEVGKINNTVNKVKKIKKK